MKNILIAVLAAVAAVACTSKVKTNLSGTVPEGTEGEVAVQIRTLGIDTTIAPENGKFSIDLPVDKMTIGYIVLGDKYASFIPDGNPIKVDFSGENAVAKAKKGANLALAKFSQWNDDFMKRYNDADQGDDSLLTVFEDEYVAKMKELTKQNNALGLFGIQNLQNTLEPSEMREILKNLPADLKQHKAVASMLESLDTKEATAAGKMFTDFEVVQPDGSVKKLSDYVGKGKYILADFWASWCGPCRREIPNVKNVYEKFHGDKFDVVSIAVWDKLEDSMKAIEEEGLVWNQILDGQRIPTDAYGIEGIPEIILFGPDGTILMRGEGLRGANMEPVIAGYLK